MIVPNKRLKDAIYLAGLTQDQLAEKVNLPQAYISLAVTGKLILADYQKLAIARALDKKIAELFND